MRDDRLNAAVAIVAALDLDGSICANALICVWENRFSKAALYSRHPPGLLGPGDCNRGMQADEKESWQSAQSARIAASTQPMRTNRIAALSARR